MDQSLRGKLLVASPVLTDPNFSHSVVVIIDHDTEGAAGLILDRPIAHDPAEELPSWAHLLDPPQVFIGGPVEPEMAVGLVDAPKMPPDGWRPIVGDIGPVDLSGHPDDIGGAERVRVWAGYSGWSPGQLEAEIAEDAWYVVDATVDDLFTTRPETLWRRVLRRQGGSLSTLSTFAPEPRWN